MKKLLGILVLGLFLANNSIADYKYYGSIDPTKHYNNLQL